MIWFYTKALGEVGATVRTSPLCAVTGGSGCTARAHDTTLQSRAKRAARAASSRAGGQAGHCAGRGGEGSSAAEETGGGAGTGGTGAGGSRGCGEGVGRGEARGLSREQPRREVSACFKEEDLGPASLTYDPHAAADVPPHPCLPARFPVAPDACSRTPRRNTPHDSL